MCEVEKREIQILDGQKIDGPLRAVHIKKNNGKITFMYLPASKASRNIANLTERKAHTPSIVVSKNL